MLNAKDRFIRNVNIDNLLYIYNYDRKETCNTFLITSNRRIPDRISEKYRGIICIIDRLLCLSVKH